MAFRFLFMMSIVSKNAFFKRLLDHVEPADQEVFFRTMELIGKNLDEIIKENA